MGQLHEVFDPSLVDLMIPTVVVPETAAPQAGTRTTKAGGRGQ